MTWRDLALARPALGALLPLGGGGQGKIFRLPEFHLAEVPVPLIYKEYRETSGGVAPQGVANVITLRAAVAREQQPWFDSHLVWPLRLVVDDLDAADATVAGIVMRLIPGAFFTELRLGGETHRVPREARFLFLDRRDAAQRGLDFPDLAARLLLCQRLAYLIAFLHRNDIVFGDISSRNVLYCLAPTPDVLLVDCDAVRKVGSAPVVAQGHAPDFMPPNPRSPQSITTDLFKLGLFVIRALSPGAVVTADTAGRTAAGTLDRTGATLVAASVGHDPAARPSALAWYRYFRSLTLLSLPVRGL
jgi:hypothetical protein